MLHTVIHTVEKMASPESKEDQPVLVGSAFPDLSADKTQTAKIQARIQGTRESIKLGMDFDSNQIKIKPVFLCPITLKIMSDPVMMSDGRTYEREAIVQWLQEKDTSPFTREPFPNKTIGATNYAIKELISDLLLEHEGLRYGTDELYFEVSLKQKMVAACQQSDLAQIKALAAKESRLLFLPLSERDEKRLLHHIVESGNPAVIRAVLEMLENACRGSALALLCTADAQGGWPIHYATKGTTEGILCVMGAMGEVVKQTPFMPKHINPSLNQKNVNPALLRVARLGSCDYLNAALQLGADLNAANAEGNTVLHYAVAHHYLALLNNIKQINQKANYNALNKAGNAALHQAVRNEYMEGVQALLPMSDLRQHNCTEGSLLHIASTRGCYSILELLLKQNTIDKQAVHQTTRDTALHVAARGGRIDIGKLLLGAGLDPLALNAKQETALHVAVVHQQVDFVKLLINSNNINRQDYAGNSALHIASSQGSVDIMHILMDAHYAADLELMNTEGNRPLHCAAQSGHAQVVDLLIQANVYVEAENKTHCTPKQLAEQAGHLDLVEQFDSMVAALKISRSQGVEEGNNISIAMTLALMQQQLQEQRTQIQEQRATLALLVGDNMTLKKTVARQENKLIQQEQTHQLNQQQTYELMGRLIQLRVWQDGVLNQDKNSAIALSGHDLLQRHFGRQFHAGHFLSQPLPTHEVMQEDLTISSAQFARFFQQKKALLGRLLEEPRQVIQKQQAALVEQVEAWSKELFAQRRAEQRDYYSERRPDQYQSEKWVAFLKENCHLASPSAADKSGKIPLAIAVYYMNLELARTLLDFYQGTPVLSWQDCIIHNQKYYKKAFLFDPSTTTFNDFFKWFPLKNDERYNANQDTTYRWDCDKGSALTTLIPPPFDSSENRYFSCCSIQQNNTLCYSVLNQGAQINNANRISLLLTFTDKKVTITRSDEQLAYEGVNSHSPLTFEGINLNSKLTALQFTKKHLSLLLEKKLDPYQQRLFQAQQYLGQQRPSLAHLPDEWNLFDPTPLIQRQAEFQILIDNKRLQSGIGAAEEQKDDVGNLSISKRG